MTKSRTTLRLRTETVRHLSSTQLDAVHGGSDLPEPGYPIPPSGSGSSPFPGIPTLPGLPPGMPTKNQKQ